jgi:hypothetical protein
LIDPEKSKRFRRGQAAPGSQQSSVERRVRLANFRLLANLLLNWLPKEEAAAEFEIRELFDDLGAAGYRRLWR